MVFAQLCVYEQSRIISSSGEFTDKDAEFIASCVRDELFFKNNYKIGFAGGRGVAEDQPLVSRVRRGINRALNRLC